MCNRGSGSLDALRPGAAAGAGVQQQAQLAQTTQRLETELRILERRQKTIHVPRGRGSTRSRYGTGCGRNLREEEREHERGRAQGW